MKYFILALVFFVGCISDTNPSSQNQNKEIVYSGWWHGHAGVNYTFSPEIILLRYDDSLRILVVPYKNDTIKRSGHLLAENSYVMDTVMSGSKTIIPCGGILSFNSDRTSLTWIMSYGNAFPPDTIMVKK